MDMMLKKWLMANKNVLNGYGVVIDNFKSGDIGFIDKATSFDLQFKKYFARVTTNHSGRLYAHIKQKHLISSNACSRAMLTVKNSAQRTKTTHKNCHI